MSGPGPRRRRTDAARSGPPALAPGPAPLGPPDARELLRALSGALQEARTRRRPLTLVCLSVPEGGAQGLEPLADLARRTVRDTDAIWRDGPGGLALVLVDADGPAAEPALARLRLRLRRRGMGAVLMGRAAPPPGIGPQELLSLAHADLRPVGRGGRA